MDFAIFCFGDGDFLTSLFRGIAAMTGSGDFRYALMLVVSYAFLTMLLMAMLRGQLLDMRWFFGVMLIYSLCLLPKVNVSIEDRLQSGWGGIPVVHVVGNVPIGLAFMASTSSKLGDWMTSTMETVFSLPSGLNYLDNGPLFASSVVSAINRFQLSNPNTTYALNNFWHDCAFYDLELGFYTMQDLADASDMESFFTAHSAGNRGFDYINTQGQHQIVDCNQAFSGYLDQDIGQAVTAGVSILPWQQQDTDTNAVLTSAASAMPIAFQYLSGLALSSSQALTQAAMINSFANGLQSFASETNASAAVMGYTQAVAEQQRSIDYGVLGKISAKTLPVVRDLFEGFIDCLFPVVAIWSLLPGGHRALLAYFRVQVWIALWPPIYSVLNYAVTFFTAVAAQKYLQICAAGYNCVAAYTLATIPGFQDALRLHATIAGYLMASIPLISWLIVSQSGAMLSAVAGRVLDGYAQPVAQAAHAVATGTIRQGSVQMDSIQAWHQDSAPTSQQGFFSTDNGNFNVRTTGSGSVAQQQLSQLAISGAWVDSVEQQYSKAHEQAHSTVLRTEQDLMQSQQHLFGVVRSTANTVDQVRSHRSGKSHEYGSVQESVQRHLDDAVRSFGKTHQSAETDTRDYHFFAQAAIKFSTLYQEQESPDWGSLQMGVSTQYGVQKMTKEQRQHVLEFLHSDEYAGALSASIRDLRSAVDETGNSVLNRTMNSVQHQNQEVQQKQERYATAKADEERTAERWQDVRSHHEEIRMALGNALLNHLQEQGIDWQKGLDDLSRGHSSPQAESIRKWVDAYLDQKQAGVLAH